MSASLDLAAERSKIITKAGTAEQMAFLLGEIAECRQGQRVIGVKSPRNFAGVERRGDLVVHWCMERLRQEIVLALLRIESAEEPQFVLLDWTTYVESGVNFGEAVRGRTRERKLLGGAHEALRSEVTKRVAAKFVATALGDHVENTAGALAILSAISTSLDFDFLHKLEGEVRT